MKHQFFITAAACAIAAAAGCSEIGTSSFSETATERLAENSDNTLTFTVDIEIPDSGIGEKAMKSIVRQIKETVYGADCPAADFEDGFRKYFDSLKSEYKETNAPILEMAGTEERFASLDWTYDISGTIAGRKGNMLSYVVTRYEYTGGAHGMTTTRAMVFDIKSGKRIEENDLFREDTKAKISESLMSHSADGYENPDDLVLFVNEIEPNGNFTVGDEGVTYIYDPYEIAPYSSGTVSITVPWTEIKDIMKRR